MSFRVAKPPRQTIIIMETIPIVLKNPSLIFTVAFGTQYSPYSTMRSNN